MEFKRERPAVHRFSLHDARIVAIEQKETELFLSVEGLADIEKDAVLTGKVVVQGVDFDSAYVYMMDFSGGCGTLGVFDGQKMKLSDFLCRFKEKGSHFEIIDEYEGYMSYYLAGYYVEGEDMYELTVELFYRGDVVYYC